MKKFSEKINENSGLKNYKYSMSVDIEGNVVSESEGDAGEIVDQLVDVIGGASESINVTNYTINTIDEEGPRSLDSDIPEYTGESKKPINESNDALYHKIYDEALKSSNFDKVHYAKPEYPGDWDGDVIYIKSKLKGTSEDHKNEFDEYEIGLHNGNIILHHTPSGYTTGIDDVEDFTTITRANESEENDANNVEQTIFSEMRDSLDNKTASEFKNSIQLIYSELHHTLGYEITDVKNYLKSIIDKTL